MSAEMHSIMSKNQSDEVKYVTTNVTVIKFIIIRIISVSQLYPETRCRPLYHMEYPSVSHKQQLLAPS